ncbi:hypothetical protein XENOCAPTIV_022114 [Xenoophorus captivus]|uniref:Uncharacterized protein n=1 Tax=Xenoophorus captivus TaxID=1517983 RepID=A0ABV0SJT4_9TELE
MTARHSVPANSEQWAFLATPVAKCINRTTYHHCVRITFPFFLHPAKISDEEKKKRYIVSADDFQAQKKSKKNVLTLQTEVWPWSTMALCCTREQMQEAKK